MLQIEQEANNVPVGHCIKRYHQVIEMVVNTNLIMLEPVDEP